MRKMTATAKLLERRLLIPAELETAQHLAKSDRSVPYGTKALWNVLPYSNYAYGVLHGCHLAAKLGLKRVSCIEFGVAGGNGLLAMERHAEKVEKLLGIEIEVYGFDTGEGLTPPRDYRDMPYRFMTGNYKMNLDELEKRLTRSRLILGDVKHTSLRFFEEQTPAPIAFASFDLDYYSSTMEAFQIFAEEHAHEHYLPRIFLHFDDTMGNEAAMYNDFVGELAAINDFNSMSNHVKIAENRSLLKFNLKFQWYHQSYIMHRFNHNLFNHLTSKPKPQSLALK
jgi:hypothetical protein